MQPRAVASPVADRLGFLLARHGRIMNVRLRQALGVAGLSPQHGATLVRLHEGGQTSQQALLDALVLDASALVNILNDLERDRLVVRVRDPGDRRRHIVQITAKGQRLVRRVEEAIAEVEREACARLVPDEVTQLHALLAKLSSRPDSSGCAGQPAIDDCT